MSAEQRLAERRVPDRVLQDRLFASFEARDHRMRRRLRDFAGGISARDLHRQRVRFRRAVAIGDLDEPDLTRRPGSLEIGDLLRDAHAADAARL